MIPINRKDKTVLKDHYVLNEEMIQELRLLEQTDEVSEKLHLMFFKMAEKYSAISSFRGYSYIKDMRVEAYINCVRMASKFDLENYSNPFAYFTLVIHRNFLNFIFREKRHQEKKWKTMKVIYEQYKLLDNVELTLSDELMNKMYPTQNN